MIVLLKTMTLKLINSFLFILFVHTSFGQNPKSKTSIELSIPHTRELAFINQCSDRNKAYVIIRNNTDSIQYFYESWNSYGYYNISFEIRHKDSIYQVVRPTKLWYRNFPSYHTVQAHESLVFPFLIVDTACTNILHRDFVFADGWIGFPQISDTVEIRAVYQLCDPGEITIEETIKRLNYKKDDYIDHLDGDIESTPVFKLSEHKTLPDPNPIIIFHEPLVSEWQKVIL
ncbi:hypothetical protein D3C87_01420 [compost metagenome]